MSDGSERKPLGAGVAKSSYGAAKKTSGMVTKSLEALDDQVINASGGVNRQIDSKKRARNFCERFVVASHQFETMEDPGGALLCARILRMVLIITVVTALLSLIIAFVIKHALPGGGVVEMSQVSSLPAPSVMICPSPWGSRFRSFQVASVQEGSTPGGEAFHDVDFDVKDVNMQALLGNDFLADIEHLGQGDDLGVLEKCHRVMLSLDLHPHGHPGTYTAFDTVRVGFRASTVDGNFNFGFFNDDGKLPQVWSFASLNDHTTGYINYDQLNIGKNEMVSGVPHSNLAFQNAGHANSTRGMTELEFYYRYFMVRNVAGQDDRVGAYIIISFLLLMVAAINNCGIFDILFVEHVPHGEEPPLEPNALFRAMCGPCFSSCRRRKDLDAPEDDAGAEDKSAA
jgi:hypothetical protein